MTEINEKSKALFLDRDGIINVDYGYVHKQENFVFVKGIFELCLKALELDYKLIVITNQAGIGRGYYTESDFQVLTKWMLKTFEEKSISFEGVYYSPYHPEAKIEKYRQDHETRKPNPGMILKAKYDHSLDMSKSLLVGDKITDIYAGINAGITSNFLLSDSEHSFDPGECVQIQNLNEVFSYI